MDRAEYECLRWRCVRRGLLELDLTLSFFLEKHFFDLSDIQQNAFAELVSMEDHQLWALINSNSSDIDPVQADLLELLRNQRKAGLSK